MNSIILRDGNEVGYFLEAHRFGSGAWSLLVASQILLDALQVKFCRREVVCEMMGKKIRLSVHDFKVSIGYDQLIIKRPPKL